MSDKERFAEFKELTIKVVKLEQKLARIKEIYGIRTVDKNTINLTNQARHNLAGALVDLERQGRIDPVCIKTIKRVITQLSEIEQVLKE